MIKLNFYGIILFVAGIMLFTACVQNESSDFSSDGSQGQGGSMARFTISGDYMYTVDHQNLKTFDISVPDQPQYMKNKEQHLGFDIETIFTMDTLLFIGSQNGMYIYDISRPGFPQQISMVSHIRSCDPVVASGKYAYVTLNSENTWCGRVSNVLNVYDISNTSQPLLIRTETGFIHPRGLGIDGNKLFVCDKGIKVFDVSDPAKPKWIDDLSHIPEANEIDAYDVIPTGSTLLVTGATGFYQFGYKGDKLSFISKIEVEN